MTDTAVNRPEITVDRPDVIVFPPVIPLSTLVIACVLQWLMPLGLDRTGSTRAGGSAWARSS